MKKKIPGFISILIIGCITVLLTKCKKEYSYEGGGTLPKPARYTLSGVGGDCINATVNGTYLPGKAMNATNNIVVEVNVDSIGLYTISTNTLNGMTFSKSDHFATTGIQTVTLQGTGTPIAAGTAPFQVNGSGGCVVNITIGGTSGGGTNNNNNSYTLVGDPNTCKDFSVRGDYTGGVALNNSNSVNILVDVKRTGPYIITTDTLDGIYFSATGLFSATGQQSVTLAGNGTPYFPRNLHFKIRGLGTSCGFPLVVQNKGPVANYVIESGNNYPNTCLFTLSGDYTQNSPLAVEHSVRIRVQVKTLGNFTMDTETVNGIFFIYSGEFTKLGFQDVILPGYGTPAARGTFLYTPTIVGPGAGTSSCGFNLTVLQ